jgi:hypothetical protein
MDHTHFVSLLGTMTDKEVAALSGRKQNTVFSYRTRLGIPAFNRERLASVADRFGTVSDADLAAEIGVPEGAVTNARKAAGVKRFKAAPVVPTRAEVAAELSIRAAGGTFRERIAAHVLAHGPVSLESLYAHFADTPRSTIRDSLNRAVNAKKLVRLTSALYDRP